MVAGGFVFDASSDDNAKRSLRTSLTKNSQTFHKLPNGKYGLREWYPNAKDRKASPDKAGETEDEENIFNMEEKEAANGQPAKTTTASQVA